MGSHETDWAALAAMGGFLFIYFGILCAAVVTTRGVRLGELLATVIYGALLGSIAFLFVRDNPRMLDHELEVVLAGGFLGQITAFIGTLVAWERLRQAGETDPRKRFSGIFRAWGQATAVLVAFGCVLVI